MERTLSMIKPDAVEKGAAGRIIARLEGCGLKIVAMRMVHLTRSQAEQFYAVHRGKPFYESLTEFMSSGRIVALILEGENAIARYRELMGATDPAKADAGTIRKDFAANVERNAVHGSDAPETAAQEIKFFFRDLDVCA